MRKLCCGALLLLAAAGLMGAKYITEHEAIVSGALTKLEFESQPAAQGLIGAPPRLKVTQKTIDHLTKLMKENKMIEIQGNGAVEIK